VLWFFCIKYYETASDLELMLTLSQNQAQQHALTRKSKCLVFRWLIFTILLLAVILQFVALDDEKFRFTAFGIAFIVFSWLIEVSIIVASISLMSLALLKFIRIVSRIQAQGVLNRRFIITQIVSLAFFMVVWVMEGCFFVQHYTDMDAYKPVKYLVISDNIGVVTDEIILFIIAFVIYKSG